jgi:ABC-type sugar transport system ATPase subunit
MEVEIQGLRFERDGRLVLDIPSLRLSASRTTAILGPNGAGKTTLLRLIAALERPRAGGILIAGQPVHADIRTRQHIAIAFQEPVFLRQSVRENLELGLRLRGLSKRARKDRVEEAAQLLGITALLDRNAGRLSVGEGRRASLARAMCLRAPLVLLDEPLAGLDAATYGRLLDELPHLLRAMGTTTLLVTHSRQEALRLGQDLVVLIDGRVHASGNKGEVASKPPSVGVADVLGYAVLIADGRRVAIPPGTFGLGPGSLEFWMVVEELLDLADHVEVVGRIGDVRIRLAAPTTADIPVQGALALVHAERAFEIPP